MAPPSYILPKKSGLMLNKLVTYTILLRQKKIQLVVELTATLSFNEYPTFLKKQYLIAKFLKKSNCLIDTF